MQQLLTLRNRFCDGCSCPPAGPAIPVLPQLIRRFIAPPWSSGLFAIAAVLLLPVFGSGPPVKAQFLNTRTGSFELSEVVDIEDIPNEAAAHRARAEALLEAEKWGEAIDILRQVSEDYPDAVVRIANRRFVSLREYCHYLLDL